MSTLKLTIPGEYWDSFIYAGRLYLFGLDASVDAINWDKLLTGWRVNEGERLALVCAFQRSDYLYLSEVADLLEDPEIKPVVTAKFARLSQSELEVSRQALRKAREGKQDNPCPFPHADIEIYNKNLYVGSKDGLFRATSNKRTKGPISSRPQREWDGPVLKLSASYGSIAAACGSEGLYEIDLDMRYSTFQRTERENQLSGLSCVSCNWMYHSIFASSMAGGYLARFSKGVEDFETRRNFEEIETASRIFGTEGFSWGVQDKLCQANGRRIKVAKYIPWAPNEHDVLKVIGSVRFHEWKGEIVSASTAPFGVVVELEHALVVFPSVGRAITIPGEPINWRVFPRSRHYENQLHIVYEDRLEIHSFNHDYLVDQRSKLLGTSVLNRGSTSRRRNWLQ